MKIARISAYRVELPLHETTYKCLGITPRMNVLGSPVVVIE